MTGAESSMTTANKFAALADELDQIGPALSWRRIGSIVERAATALREADGLIALQTALLDGRAAEIKRLAWLPAERDTGSQMEEYRHWGNTGFNNCLAAIRAHRNADRD